MFLIKFYGRKWKVLRISSCRFHREILYSCMYPHNTFQIPGLNSACKDSGCPIVGFKTRSSPLKSRGMQMMKKRLCLWYSCLQDTLVTTSWWHPSPVVHRSPNTWSSSLCCHSFLCVLTSTVPKFPEQERRGEVVNKAVFPNISIFSDHDPKAWNIKPWWICLARGSNLLQIRGQEPEHRDHFSAKHPPSWTPGILPSGRHTAHAPLKPSSYTAWITSQVKVLNSHYLKKTFCENGLYQEPLVL